MSVRVRTREVVNSDNKIVTVTRAVLLNEVVIEWPCGAVRRFEHDQVLTALDAIETVHGIDPEARVKVVDKDGLTADAWIDGSVLRVLDGTGIEGASMPWEDIKYAVRRAAKSRRRAALTV